MPSRIAAEAGSRPLVVVLALTGIVSAILSALVTVPLIGWGALLAVPVLAGIATAAVGFLLGRAVREG